MHKKLLIVVNVGWFFISHRLQVALGAQKSGYRVHVAASLEPRLDVNTVRILESHGLVFHNLRFSRSGASLREIGRDLLDLMRLFRSTRPDLVHLVTLKPILLGGLAARLAGISRVVLAIPGRGSVFSARGIRATLRRWAVLVLYRFAYQRAATRVIVQNVEDRDYFVSRRVFDPKDVRLIRGSGVDLRKFPQTPEPPGDVVIVFASRMLKEKGVENFVRAAKALLARGVRARCVLVGEPDEGNPHSHTREELLEWQASGAVEWWGFSSDIRAVFERCHIVCLPTYYGEGVPKVLIEAAASARPIVTTDIPGCRDIVRHGYNGLLVRQHDHEQLVAALARLITDPEERRAMGERGRRLAEEEFSIEKVVTETLDVYESFAK